MNNQIRKFNQSVQNKKKLFPQNKQNHSKIIQLQTIQSLYIFNHTVTAQRKILQINNLSQQHSIHRERLLDSKEQKNIHKINQDIMLVTNEGQFRVRNIQGRLGRQDVRDFNVDNDQQEQTMISHNRKQGDDNNNRLRNIEHNNNKINPQQQQIKSQNKAINQSSNSSSSIITISLNQVTLKSTIILLLLLAVVMVGAYKMIEQVYQISHPELVMEKRLTANRVNMVRQQNSLEDKLQQQKRGQLNGVQSIQQQQLKEKSLNKNNNDQTIMDSNKQSQTKQSSQLKAKLQELKPKQSEVAVKKEQQKSNGLTQQQNIIKEVKPNSVSKVINQHTSTQEKQQSHQQPAKDTANVQQQSTHLEKEETQNEKLKQTPKQQITTQQNKNSNKPQIQQPQQSHQEQQQQNTQNTQTTDNEQIAETTQMQSQQQITTQIKQQRLNQLQKLQKITPKQQQHSATNNQQSESQLREKQQFIDNYQNKVKQEEENEDQNKEKLQQQHHQEEHISVVIEQGENKLSQGSLTQNQLNAQKDQKLIQAAIKQKQQQLHQFHPPQPQPPVVQQIQIIQHQQQQKAKPKPIIQPKTPQSPNPPPRRQPQPRQPTKATVYAQPRAATSQPIIPVAKAGISRQQAIKWREYQKMIDLPLQAAADSHPMLIQEQHYYQKKYNISKYNQLPICVVVPTYNNVQGNRYQDNLKSILQQNYTNYHVVIIDDKSTDNTGQAINQYVATLNPIFSQKIKVIINKQRKMAMPNLRYAAMNQCKQNQLFIIVDGDDLLIGRQVFKLFSAVMQQKDYWVMWTNFLSPKGAIGYSRQYPAVHKQANNYRKAGFVMSHLRAYYTKLFRLIKQQDLKDQNGQFFHAANDVAIGVPILQMAHKHVGYVPQISYYYNMYTGLNNHKVRLKEQKANDKLIRKKTRYQALKSLDFNSNTEINNKPQQQTTTNLQVQNKQTVINQQVLPK